MSFSVVPQGADAPPSECLVPFFQVLSVLICPFYNHNVSKSIL